MKDDTAQRNQHYNRIKEIIENPQNTFKDLAAIEQAVENFGAIFGQCKLLERLKEKQTLLTNKFEQ